MCKQSKMTLKDKFLLFIVFHFYLLCVNVLIVAELEILTPSYDPSPYHLEDYCNKEDEGRTFHIDSWKGAIFHLGKKFGPDGMPNSRKIHKCKINIKTKKDFWLTAAIEHMKIRGKRDASSNKWICSDFLQFLSPARHVINKIFLNFDISIFNDKKSEELCGEKKLDGENYENIYDLSTNANSFNTASNIMTIIFHQDNDEKHTASNSFTLVITTYRHSSEQVFAAECEGKQKCVTRRDSYCIDQSFICDGHVNCAFPGSGTDERLCPESMKSNIFNLTSTIIIALTAIVSFCVLICIFSTIICKLKSRLTGQRPRHSNRPPRSLALEEYPTAPRLEPESTLPPYESAISSDHFESKGYMNIGETDLPPKYETLFPEGHVVSSDIKEDPSNSNSNDAINKGRESGS